MTPCERTQPLLLEHLYDLLEGEERLAVAAHLAECASCQASLATARDQQRLLAIAAKERFETVRFTKPAPEKATPIIAMPTRTGYKWGRYALAACLLIAVTAGLVVPGSIYWSGRQDLNNMVAIAQADRTSVQERVDKALAPARGQREQAQKLGRDLQAVQMKQQEAQINVQQEVLAKERFVRVTGPETIEPGAPNDYNIEVFNLSSNQPVDTKLGVRLRDGADKEIAGTQTLALRTESPGRYRLSLPRDLDVKATNGLFLELFETTEPAKEKEMKKGEATPKPEGAKEASFRTALRVSRPLYITHLTTDKPMYKPTETVWFRSLTLERYSLKPADEPLHLMYSIADANNAEVFQLAGGTQLVNAADSKPILGPDQKPVKGIGAGAWQIPVGTAGGEYTLTVSDQYQRFPPEKRKFLVNEYEISPFRKKLEFTKKSYGPGDDVVAACLVEPAAGGRLIARQPVRATVRVDGKTVGVDGKESATPITLQTDDIGAVAVRFRLPTQIERGEASLSVTFTDGASNDTIVRTIPIILKKFYVQLYPEGGDLVVGVPNRVYFQARTTLDKPADLTGRVVDQDARVVARLETLNDAKEPGANQGMGSFEFTPEAGKKYSLQIDNPVGVVADYEFPALKADGVVLHVEKPVMPAKDSIAVRVHDTKGGRSLLVGVYCRGRLLAHKSITTKAKEPADLKLEPASGVGGVYRVSVFEEQLTSSGRQFTPRAERLVYRAPAEKLDLTLRPHRARFMPGEKVFLNLQAKDEVGKPAPSILMVSVIDGTVKSMADEKTAKAMPTHFYVGTEVRKPEDLEFADFMLGEHPKAPLALDLLLGTQGWRRFAEQDPAKFQEKYKDDAVRMMATIGQTPFQATNHDEVQGIALQRIQNEVAKAAVGFAQQMTALQKELNTANAEATQAEAASALAVREVRRELREIELALNTALGQLEKYDLEWRNLGLMVLGLALVGVCLVTVLIGLIRKGRAAQLCYAVAACSAILFAVGLMWLSFRELGAPKNQEIVFAGGGGDPSAVKSAEPEDLREVLKDEAANLWQARARGFGVAKDAPKHAPREAVDAFQIPAAPADPARAVPPAPVRADADDAGARARLNFGDGKKEAGAEFFKQQQGGKDKNIDGLRKMAEGAELPKTNAEARMKLEAKLVDEVARERMARPATKPAPAATPPAAGTRAAGLERRFLPAGEGKGDAKAAMGGIQGAPAGIPLPGRGGLGAGGAGLGGPGGGGGRGPAGPGPGYPGAAGGFGYASIAEAPPPPPIVVREYAHRRSGAPSNIRRDFTETLAWLPVVVLPDGSGKIEFELNDSLTTFEALAYGHTVDGRLGVGRFSVESRLPFSVQPKIPIEVTASDKIDIAVSIANETDEKREVSVSAEARGLKLAGKASEQLTLGAEQRGRRVFRLTPELVEGQAELNIRGSTEFFNDSVLRSIRIVPDGFPIHGSHSDVLEKIARNEVVLPQSWIKGTLQLQVQVYPSTLADLQKGLEGLLREPNGCFEQTSTSNYPNIMILDYLRESEQARPEVTKRAQDLLDRGYTKLTSFECRKQGANGKEGYEWFGGAAPPHEALTAYGLLQFRDMARVHHVDANMVERTKTYLLSRRDGMGGFKRNPRALDTFGRAPEEITNAYIVWALTESSKDDDVTKELDVLKTQAKSSQDAYFLALVANCLLNRGQNDDGMSILKRLAQAQKPEGQLDGERTSITGSSGRHLQIETTSLTLLAWLKANQPVFTKNIQSAVRWIGKQRDGSGAFGSTQSTILAMKALITHTKANKRPAEPGELSLYVGAERVATQPFQPSGPEVPPLVLKGEAAEKFLKAGKNDIRVEVTGNNVFPYTLSWSYQTLKPASAEGCPVQIETKLDKTEANENDTVRLNVSVKNISGKGQAMTIAIVGLPAGLTLPEDMKQLQDYTRLEDNGTKPGRISAWEIRGRELVLYWRDLAPDANISVPLDLVCRVPGEYRGPASRAYLYYNSDTKHWIDPLSIRIKAGE